MGKKLPIRQFWLKIRFFSSVPKFGSYIGDQNQNGPFGLKQADLGCPWMCCPRHTMRQFTTYKASICKNWFLKNSPNSHKGFICTILCDFWPKTGYSGSVLSFLPQALWLHYFAEILIFTGKMWIGMPSSHCFIQSRCFRFIQWCFKSCWNTSWKSVCHIRRALSDEAWKRHLTFCQITFTVTSFAINRYVLKLRLCDWNKNFPNKYTVRNQNLSVT